MNDTTRPTYNTQVHFTAHTQFETGAQKELGGKPPVSYVPQELILGAARAFEFGAKKYSPHNWRKGIPASELYSALQRHMMAWISGEDFANDSELNHLDHAAACLGMLMHTVQTKPNLDDRYIDVGAAKL